MDNKYDPVMTRLCYWYVRGPKTVTVEDIRTFEHELGYSLPSDYHEFLQKYGLASGEGDIRIRGVDDDDDEGTSVDVFYGLNSGDEGYDLIDRRLTFANRLPNHLLPFIAGSGGEFCLCLSGKNIGKVYWWFQETGAVQSEDELEPIADSFDNFMISLVMVDED